MNTSRHSALITALAGLPEHELVEVVNCSLSQRSAEVARPEFEEAKLLLAEAYRVRNIDDVASSWDLLILAGSEVPGEIVTSGSGPTQEGSCCGVTLVAYTNKIICPICGKSVHAT